MAGTATWQALQAASQGQVLLPAPQAPTFLLLQRGGRGGRWGQGGRSSFALEAAHGGQGKALAPQVWSAARGLGPVLRTSVLPPEDEGRAHPGDKGTRLGVGWGGEPCSHHQGPTGHTLAFLEAGGFFRFLCGWTRPRRAGGTGRDGRLSGCSRRPVGLLPPRPAGSTSNGSQRALPS